MEGKRKTVVTVISKIADRPISMEACFVVIYGMEIGRKYNLDKSPIIIGRSTKSDIQVDQESVSRNHAKITNLAKGVSIKDLGSTNGTYVNDKLVKETVLKDGDFIKIGRTIFKFLSGSNIENAYHEEIYRLTTIDGLTQIFNKRCFLENLERELSRAHRYGRELSLMLFDIDNFKNVNDTFGHLAGDFVLKDLADVIRPRIRREDFFARYGGEEFVIILPEIDAQAALTTAEKVRLMVESHSFIFEDTKIPITISIGVATYTDQLNDAQELIKVADQNMYSAKKQGRNRVVG